MGCSRCISVFVLVLLPLLSIVPLGAQSIQLENVYVLDGAVQGRWYAIHTAGLSYRPFYIDSYGNTVYISVYLWDANQSYIIFQSPINGRIYLRREQITLSTLTTKTWFNPPPTPSITFTVIYPSPWDGTATWSPTQYTYGSINEVFTFNGQYINYTLWRTVSGTTSVLAEILIKTTTAEVSASTSYTATVNLPQSLTMTNIHYNVTAQAAATTSSGSTSLDRWKGPFTSVGQTFFYVLPVTKILLTNSSVSLRLTTPPSYNGTYTYYYNHYRVTIYVRLIQSPAMIRTMSLYSMTNNVIQASNGNTINVMSISQLPFYNIFIYASTYAYQLYSQRISISFNSTRMLQSPITILVNTTSAAQKVPSPNPAVFIPSLSTWLPAQIIDYGATNSIIIFIPPSIQTSSLDVEVVYNYPIRYTAPSIEYIRCTGTQCLQYLPVQGDLTSSSGDSIVFSNGSSIYLGQYIGWTMYVNLSGSYIIEGSEIGSAPGWIHRLYISSPDAKISAYNGSFTLTTLLLMNTRTEHGYTYTVDAMQLKMYTLSQMSYVVSGEVVGSWGYRVPIYIQLYEYPTRFDGGYVFRVRLPLQTWIRMELLSPSLEDLLIVDSAMKPVPFYVVDANSGVVYIRHEAPLTTSNIVFYALLKNRQLWGTGTSFSTIKTFDSVNPREFVDDFGYNVFYSYMVRNMLVVIPSKDVHIKMGLTWYDVVAFNHTMVYEQHGSIIAKISDISIAADTDILVVSSQTMDTVYVYGDGAALFSVELGRYNSSPIQYWGWRCTGCTVFVGKTVLHGYSVGQISGGLQNPTPVNRPQQVNVGAQIDWLQLFLLIFVMIGLGIAARLMTASTGGGGGGVLSRF